MKKYLILIVCLLSYTAVYSQKKSIVIGMPTFNHFDGFGFTVSEAAKGYHYLISGLLAETMLLSYERRIDDKNSITISYNGFYHQYQKMIPHYRGLIERNFFNLNLQYRRTLWHLRKKRIIINGQSGINWRFEGNEAFHLQYIIIDGVNPQIKPNEEGLLLSDYGLSLGASVRIKILKGLFANVQSNYTYYLIGEDLRKNYYGIKKSTQVLSAALSLGYSF